MRGLVVSLSVFLAGASEPALAAGDLPADPGRWLKIRSAHLDVFTDLPESKATDFVLRLETFRTVLLETTSGLPAPRQERLTIFLFRGADSFRPFLHERGHPWGTRGYFFHSPDGRFLLINTTPARNIGSKRASDRYAYPDAPVFHEFVHLIFDGSGAELPRWLDEGLAEYFSTLWIDEKAVEVGQLVPHYLDPFPHASLESAEAILSWRQGREPPWPSAYGNAWWTVHYLQRSDPETRGAFGRFLALLLDGVPQPEAWRTAFGKPPRDVLAGIRKHLRQRAISIPRYDLAAFELDRRVVSERAESDELYLALGLVAANQSPLDSDVGDRLLREVLRARPDSAEALAGLATLDARRGRVREAEALYRRALAANPECPSAAYRLALLLFSTNPDGSAGASASRREEARSLLESVLAAEPDSRFALSLYGISFLHDRPGSPVALAALDRARKLGDGDLASADAYVVHALAAGERDRAARALLWDAFTGDRDRLRRARDAVLDHDRREAAHRAESEGRDAAVAYLERAVEATLDAPLREALERALVERKAAGAGAISSSP